MNRLLRKRINKLTAKLTQTDGYPASNALYNMKWTMLPNTGTVDSKNTWHCVSLKPAASDEPITAQACSLIYQPAGWIAGESSG
jgi:hypothetical protein